ncbi:hypothetical protein FBU30_005355 [Linnemannia zychae]|nr:hypothetical protein FBU30_005355 [Linnemannia zychae]
MIPRTAISLSTKRFAQDATKAATSLGSSSLSTAFLSRSYQTSSIQTSSCLTTSPLRSYIFSRSSPNSPARSLFTATSSCSVRPVVSNGSATFFSRSSSSPLAKYQKTASILTRPYTSLPSRPASSSAAATAGRVLAEESTSVASSTVSASRTTPLSFHEEMTKVRFSFNWWKEWTIIMGVFAVTGSTSVMFVKPLLKEVFKLDGSWREGPWSFRIAYICTTLPLYSCILLTVASIAGRRPYFKKVVLRMWSRFLPKKVIQRLQ